MHFLLVIFSFCFIIQSLAMRIDENIYIPSTKTPTSSRGGMALASFTDEGLIAVFGGFSGRDYYNDLWLYNLMVDEWNEIYPASKLIPCNF